MLDVILHGLELATHELAIRDRIGLSGLLGRELTNVLQNEYCRPLRLNVFSNPVERESRLSLLVAILNA